jgi:23S rRNA pseudouridine2605 synthase
MSWPKPMRRTSEQTGRPEGRTLRRRGARSPANGHSVGLARALSKLGFCSRSRAAELVRAGRVRLNGAARQDPEAPVAIERDRIQVDGRVVGAAARAYWMMNKPRGVLTTASDEKGRETVYSYLPAEVSWLAPVGRLDKASEGLLLLTNDSAWAARITSPESHLDKTYHVQIGTVADPQLADELKRGVRAESGVVLRVKRAEVLRQGERNSWLTIVLDEGRNRQIRRIFEALGIEVLRLVRVAMGSLRLGDLPKGKCRELTRPEIHALGVR